MSTQNSTTKAGTRTITFLAISAGSLLEWAEFSFYAFMVPLFAHLFFPNMSSLEGMLSAFAVFGVSYLVRPLGALFWGSIGDRLGRKAALVRSIFWMGIGTLGIGLLPTHATLGAWAAVFLCVFRLIQGFSMSGEFLGSAVCLVETHFARWRFLPSGCVSVFSAMGMLLGAIAAQIISGPSMPEWAWRVPYFIGALSCLVALFARMWMPESEDFTQLKQRAAVMASPAISSIKQHFSSILRVAAISALINSYIYTCVVWWTTYALNGHAFDHSQVRWLSTSAQIAVVIFIPLVAMLAEKVSALRLMRIGLIGSIVVVYALFATTHLANFYLTLGVFIAYALMDACITSVMFVYFGRLFPTGVRYSGTSIAWNIAAAILGGFTPLIAAVLSAHISVSIGSSILVMVTALLALWSLRKDAFQ